MSKWISVEDRLPPVSEYTGEHEVLIVVSGQTDDAGIIVSVGSLMQGDGNLWHDVSSDAYNDPLEWYGGDVTHWMPLPEPPD